MRIEPTASGRPEDTDVPADGNGRARTPAARTTDSRSLGDLLRELSSEGADLVRQEVALAKAEMNEKVDVVGRTVATMAVGGALLLAALLLGAWTLNTGLTALLTEVVGIEVAVWMAPLILTAILALSGWGMITKGRDALSDEGLTPDMTRRTLEEDARWAGRKAREIKEEIKHG